MAVAIWKLLNEVALSRTESEWVYREAVAIDGVVDPEAVATVPVVAVAVALYDHVSLGFGRPTDELSSFTLE